MATNDSGKHHGQRTGRPTPRGAGKIPDVHGGPTETQAEPESGPRRDPLPTEYQDEGSDLPGLRRKIDGKID